MTERIIELETIVGTLKTTHILHIELNRPKVLNAMNAQLFKDLQTAFRQVEELKKKHDIRVIILTGRGKHFTAGLDLREAGSIFLKADDIPDVARKAIRIYDLLKDWQESMVTLEKCTVPVLAGVHGSCVGAGIDLITSADVRYCIESAKFTIKEIDIGMAADLGTLQRIGNLTSNHSLARELCYTGRVFTSEEAKELGLISKVFKNEEELQQGLMRLAEEIGKQDKLFNKTLASKSPVGIWTIKKVMVHEQRQDSNLEVMARTNMAMLNTTDVMEAIRANLTKSKAIYPKL